MKRIAAGLTIAMALTVTGPLTAQERPLGQRADSAARPGMMQPGMMGMTGRMQRMHGQGGMMGMMGGGMMGMAGGPAMILRLEESLDLTADQVERLKALREDAQAEMRQHMMQGMQTLRAAQELLNGESPDVDGYEERLREAANHMVLAHTAMARTAAEARELLTPEQRDRLALGRSMMQEMRGGRMDGMMLEGLMPGMQPGQQRPGHHPPAGGGSGR